MIGIQGIPFDKNSSYREGSEHAPGRIREALFCDSSNLWAENGYDLDSAKNIADIGYISDLNIKTYFKAIKDATSEILERKVKVISLGGDHSVTFPIIQSYAEHYPKFDILHFDAHSDLYDELDGNKNSHACPFARIMEKKLAARLVQVGIRTMNGHQNEQAKRFGVEVIYMKDISKGFKPLKFDNPVYLSIDLDCLDPAFAPGVSHHEPGGMTTRQLIDIIQQIDSNIIGADIVEYNPERDLSSVTAMVAAKLLKEIMAKMDKKS
ncbi:agmatinase [bacterium]|nr:agmatinase [bacterium]